MNPETVVNYLEMVSNKSISTNLIIHIITFFSIAIYWGGSLRARKIAFNGLIFILTAAVTVTAFMNQNPFHLLTFATLSIIALIELVNGKSQVKIPEKNISMRLALIFLLLGIWYPEFVHANPLALLFISPMGIVPCPTLIVILSLLAFNRHGVTKTAYITNIIIGAIYAVIGVFVLKVYLDITLLILVLYSIFLFVTRDQAAVTRANEGCNF